MSAVCLFPSISSVRSLTDASWASQAFVTKILNMVKYLFITKNIPKHIQLLYMLAKH